MYARILTASIIASIALAACGGGGIGGGGYHAVTPPVTATPTPVPPGPNPAPSPGAAPASAAQILGAPGWTDPSSGMTLYVFAADQPDVSNCNGGCAAIWPPLMAGAGAQATGGFTVITRADGSRQWAYKHQPLYRFSGDSMPGDAHGDGLLLNGGIWHVARP